MTTIRAHFDGRVLVPEQPLHLPLGRVFEIQLHETTDLAGAVPSSTRDWIGEENGLPMVILPPNAKLITDEAVRLAREQD